jgi:hypothetical protein
LSKKLTFDGRLSCVHLFLSSLNRLSDFWSKSSTDSFGQGLMMSTLGKGRLELDMCVNVKHTTPSAPDDPAVDTADVPAAPCDYA